MSFFNDDEDYDDESWRESRDAYARRDFWNAFYQEGEAGDVEKGETYDWWADYKKLKPFLLQYVGGSRAGKVLMLGCGSSELPLKLHADGWSSITCVDFSQPLIRAMKKLHAGKAGLKWEVMDARDLSDFEDGSFDAVIEKGLIDAISYADDYQEEIEKVVSEAVRVLRPGGVHFCVSVKGPDAMEPLLQNEGWEGGSVRECGKPTPSTFLYTAVRSGAPATEGLQGSSEEESAVER